MRESEYSFWSTTHILQYRKDKCQTCFLNERKWTNQCEWVKHFKFSKFTVNIWVFSSIVIDNKHLLKSFKLLDIGIDMFYALIFKVWSIERKNYFRNFVVLEWKSSLVSEVRSQNIEIWPHFALGSSFKLSKHNWRWNQNFCCLKTVKTFKKCRNVVLNKHITEFNHKPIEIEFWKHYCLFFAGKSNWK